MKIFRKGEHLLDIGMILVMAGLVTMCTDVVGLTSIFEGFKWNVGILLLGAAFLCISKFMRKKDALV